MNVRRIVGFQSELLRSEMMTYSDYGNIFNMVLEATGLLASILLRHPCRIPVIEVVFVFRIGTRLVVLLQMMQYRKAT